ncbi:hypothetical protein CNMCM5793_006409 [Aspergillus hiratsukae]|uniref:Uncharacterized protein n=1 Tax=Aspergillus hiratsukae TaxID=1194566 RepID=A0A8H6PHC2_9EURO|nr:hypothetical protein CNMCM5793_006409 [Aspergillus hiratsukae]KAF7173114.1 hypothetical protein CNMCM6106_007257 [Aspergillus hiratsukae]
MSHASISSRSNASTTPKSSTDITDYHVGWICSSTKEYLAALSVMDESHDDRQRPCYKLGRIEEHNIVINKAWAGPRSDFRAVEVAADMKYSFPWIRFILTVGIANSNPNSKEKVKPGDIVIGTNILSCPDDSAATALANRKRSPTRTLVHAGITGVMLRIEERQVEWDLIDEIIENMKKGPIGLSRRPEYPDLSRGHRPNKTPAQSPTVRLGLVDSFQGTMQTTQVGSDIGGQDSILCFDMGTADMLAAGIDCLAICGISDFAQAEDRNAQHDYTDLAAAAAAVCARELLTCIYPETVVEIMVTVSQEQMEDIMNGVMRRLQKITGAAPVKETTAAIEELERNVNLLGEEVHFIQTSQHDKLQSTLQDLSERISRQEQQASDYATKKELQELRDKIESNRLKLDVLFQQTESALKAGRDTLNDAAEIVGNDKLKIAAMWTNFASQTTGRVAEFMPSSLLRPGKGKEPHSSRQYDPQPGPSTSTRTDSITGNKINLLGKSKDLLTRPFRGTSSRGPVPVPRQEQDNATTFAADDAPEAGNGILYQSQRSERSRPGPTPIQTGRTGYGSSERGLSLMSSRSPSQSNSIFSPTYAASLRSTSTPPMEPALRSSSSQVFNNQRNALPARGSTDSEVDRSSIAGVRSTRAKLEGKVPFPPP